MKNLITTALLISLAMPAAAGGPVLPTEEREIPSSTVQDKKIGWVPVAIIALIGIGIATSGGGGGDRRCNSEPIPPTDNGDCE
jgi:hypothetical protein